ncbi:MAG: amino acid ABC transporter permease [Trichococcus sp.]|uniref:amino acid ABC transporter permease n=1 Tax=Trichococcus sp. TaxID=1985464 RepID=UPI003C34BF61
MNRPFDITYIWKAVPEILSGLGVTLQFLIGTIVIGGLLGFLATWARISGSKWLRAIVHSYIWIIRCTPSIVMMFLVFYGLPEVLLGVFDIDINSWNRINFVIIALSLLFSAPCSEIMRSAYQAVAKVQREAALSIGLTEAQAFRRIVLPQALVSALPNLGNSFILLMKEGALAYTIGIVDIMGKGQLIIGRNLGGYSIETYIALAGIYWLLTLAIEKAFKLAEDKLSAGKQPLRAA